MKRAKAIIFLVALFAITGTRQARALIFPEFSIDYPVAGLDPGAQVWPAVGFNDSVYVVAWLDTPSNTNTAVLHLQRFDLKGQSLGGMQTLPATNVTSVEIASNGKEFMILWGSRNVIGSSDNYIAKLDGSGNFLSDSMRAMGAVGGFPKIASNGTDYIAFNAFPHPAFRRFNDNTIGELEFLTASSTADGNGGVIASDGDQYLAVWASDSGGARRIIGKFIPRNGVDTNAPPFEIASGNVANPSVAYGNGMYVVTWQIGKITGSDIAATRIAANGAVLDATPIPVHGGGMAGAAVVGPNGGGFRVIYYHFDYDANDYSVRAQALSTNGLVGVAWTVAPVYSGAIQELAITARGKNAMAAWARYAGESDYDVFARFIPPDEGPGDILVLQRGPNIQSAPSVARGTNEFLVVWQDNRNTLTNRDDIVGRFVDDYGRAKGGTFAIGRAVENQTSPSVAAAGDHYLVAWRHDGDVAGNGPDIRGALLINESVVKEFTFCAMTNWQRAPAIASNGRDFLVVWRDGRNGNEDIYGMHVSHDGVMLGPADGFPICTNVSNQTAPVVASNGTNYLVAWRDEREAMLYGDNIYGSIVQAGSTNLPVDFAISGEVTTQRAVDVASNGKNYFVVWRDDRNKVTLPATWIGIYGAIVSADGVVETPNGIALTPRATHQREPSIARAGDGYILTWLEDPVAVGSYNAYARKIYSDGSTNSPTVKLSETTFDEETLAIAGGGAENVALVVSQTTEPVSRVRAVPICFDHCPVVSNIELGMDVRTIGWSAEAGQKYWVEFKRDLNELTWTPVAQITAFEDGRVEFAEGPADAARFYRINRVQP